MGKQRSKDRAYISASEWATEWGGAKDRGSLPFSRLPFHCCALTFTPFEDPVCTDDGVCFEIVNIVPYLRKHKRHPVTGAPLALSELTRLHFHRNADGEYHCPVLNKVFTESTHIVAVKPSGNVYSYQAVEELNIRAKNWKDLLTDEPFKRSDLIILQDPLNLSARLLTEFDHVRSGLRAEERPSGGMHSLNTNLSGDMARALAHLDTDTARDAFQAGGGGRAAQAERVLAAAKQASAPDLEPVLSGVVGLDAPLTSFKPGTHTWNSDAPAASRPGQTAGAVRAAVQPAAPGAARQPTAPEARPSAARAGVVGGTAASMRSSGACAASFTSSAATPVTRNEAAAPAVAESRATRKAFVAIHTSKGDLNVELHADLVPRACRNFLLLAARGFYDGVVFHRSIRNFMLQGGDPSGTGRGGESAWGRPFADEFVPSLSHSGRGVVAMANAGAHSNGSQFFILYKSAPHLDKKHTVFGRVVGGLDTTLSALERVPTDADDRPTEEIRIESITVFDDPFADPEPAPAAKAEEPEEEDEEGLWWTNPSAGARLGLVPQHDGPGKFVPALAHAAPVPAKRQKTAPSGGFGDFAGW